MSSVARTRPVASTPLILVAVMITVTAQLVTSSPGTSQAPRHPQRSALQAERAAALKETAATTAAMAATIVKSITPPPAAPAPAPARVTTTTTTTTTTPPPPASSAPAAAPAPAVAPAPAAVAATPAPAPSDPVVVPPIGQAAATGCSAALAYLQAYAAKGFSLECPGYAEGREAMTCMNQPGVCPGTSEIAIADACPEAYMNEASNSFVITGVSSAPIDPYGPCP